VCSSPVTDSAICYNNCMTKNKKALIAAGVSGLVISGCWLSLESLEFEVLFYVVLYGAGVVYGLMTMWFVFGSLWRRIVWVLVSGVSYFLAVYVTLDIAPADDKFGFPDPGPQHFLVGGLLGAIILGVGYALLQRRVTASRLTLAIVLGGLVAYVVGFKVFIEPAGDYLFSLLWPVWQVAVTYALLRGTDKEVRGNQAAA
jgi:hypothetical protein